MGRERDFSHIPIIDVSELGVGGPTARRVADELGAACRESGFFYVVGLSSQTLIYKGMLTASQLEAMFPDLSDEDLASALARNCSAWSLPRSPADHAPREARVSGPRESTPPPCCAMRASRWRRNGSSIPRYPAYP